MSILSNNWHVHITEFLMDKGLLSIISADCGQLVKMLISLEPHGIFGSNFAYLFILISYSFYKSQDTLQSNIFFYILANLISKNRYLGT